MPDPLYVVEREFAVPLSRAWTAWTDPDELQQWYAPTDLSVVAGSVVSQPYAGGLWTVAVDATPYGFIAYFYGRFTEVEPGERFVHTLHYTQDAGEFAGRDESTEYHLIDVSFAVTDAGTRVRFAQIGEMDPEQAELTRQGTSSYFDSLERYLADS